MARPPTPATPPRRRELFADMGPVVMVALLCGNENALQTEERPSIVAVVLE